MVFFALIVYIKYLTYNTIKFNINAKCMYGVE